MIRTPVLPFLILVSASACSPRRVAPEAVTAMTVAELQRVVARGPFPDDPCQASWFYAVADTRAAGAALDAVVASGLECPLPVAAVRLVALGRSDHLSWATESRAPEAATRLQLARFAATSKWEPGTSAIADLVTDEDPRVRLAAIAAVSALRLSIAAGQLERSLEATPPRPFEERALLCATLTGFGLDVSPKRCGGLRPVEVEVPSSPGRPPPNLCRTAITNLASPDPSVQLRALLELARPHVEHRLGCQVPLETLLRLVQHGPPELRAAAAMLALWMVHPPDMRRAPGWPGTIVAPDR